MFARFRQQPSSIFLPSNNDACNIVDLLKTSLVKIEAEASETSISNACGSWQGQTDTICHLWWHVHCPWSVKQCLTIDFTENLFQRRDCQHTTWSYHLDSYIPVERSIGSTILFSKSVLHSQSLWVCSCYKLLLSMRQNVRLLIDRLFGMFLPSVYPCDIFVFSIVYWAAFDLAPPSVPGPMWLGAKYAWQE
jgi:hypothetical protein